MAKKQVRGTADAARRATTTVEVAREELEVSKREVETGVVRVRKVVHTDEKLVQERLRRQVADIERVPVNRLLSEPVEPRYEGDTLIVPVVEEVLVKRWLLKEEVRIRRSRIETPHEERVVLKSEEVIVEREEPSPAQFTGMQPGIETIQDSVRKTDVRVERVDERKGRTGASPYQGAERRRSQFPYNGEDRRRYATA